MKLSGAAAAIMSGTIFVAAGVLLLAIQVASISADDLESMKENAIALISKTNTKFSDDFEDLIGHSKNVYYWVAKNDSVIDWVRLPASDAINDVHILAEELVERGKAQDKPLEYFSCVEQCKNNAAGEIETELQQYLLFIQSLKETTMRDMETGLNFMVKLFTVTQDVYRAYVSRIKSCEDETCIADILQEAKNVYARADAHLRSALNRTVRSYLKFKAVAREAASDTGKTISTSLKNGQSSMQQC